MSAPPRPAPAIAAPVPPRAGCPALRALLAHPGFLPAMRASAAHLRTVHRGRRLPRLLFGDRSRIVIAFLAAGLRDEGGTVSVGRLVEVARAQRLCGRGRALAIIAAMRLGGFLAVRSAPGDRRLRLLAPTRKLLDSIRLRLAGHLRAMSPIFPEAAVALERLHEDALLARIMARGLAHYLAGFRLVELAPRAGILAERDAAAPLACEILLALPEEGEAPPVPLSVSALAEDCGVSRAHVRLVLGELEAAGLIRLRRAGRLAEGVSTGFAAAVAPAFAGLFLVLADAVGEALRARA